MTKIETDVLRKLFFLRPKGSMLQDVSKGVISSLTRKGLIWSVNGGFGNVYMISDRGISTYLGE